MTSMKELVKIGTEFGLTGTELKDFIRDEQAREREEREVERDARRIEREHEALMIKEKRAIEREKEEMSVKEHERRLQELELESKVGAKEQAISNYASAPRVKGPKLTPFEEERDNIDSYLERFERYARTQKWDYFSEWAPNLSVLLKGKALDVFSRMPVGKAFDYGALKDALLKRFEMTVEGFRKRFRSCTPEAGETFSQFAVRLESYLVKWTELSSTDKTYEDLKDLMLRDQFLHACAGDLVLFLKERTPKSIEEMAKYADQFAEARGNPLNLSKSGGTRSSNEIKTTHEKLSQNRKSFQNHSNAGSAKKSPVGGKLQRKCYICRSEGHLSFNCPSKKTNQNRVSTVFSGGEGQLLDTTYVEGGKCEQKFGNVGVITCSPLIYSVDEPLKTKANMPIVKGFVGDKPVMVLRDTGCSGAVIKRSLVDVEGMDGETEMCYMADGRKVEVPVANVFVDTPYFVGMVRAWCLEHPVYDVILGNFEGVRNHCDPDPCWHNNVVQNVQTRAQKWAEGRAYRPMKVPLAWKDIASPDVMKEEQELDETLTKCRKFAREATTRERNDGSFSKFLLRRGLLYREFQSPRVSNGRLFRQLVVPRKYREAVLKVAHDSIMSGHLGSKRTSDRITAEFYWPGITSDVTRYCRSCDACQRTYPKGKIPKVPLGTMPLIDSPFQRIAVDIVGPLQPVTDRGNRYILTIVDYATRYPEAVPLKGIETERVAEALVDVFSRVGIPREILTDKGSQFTSNLMKEVSRLLSIRQLTTTPYHPMCNGLVEKFNGTLKSMLRKMCAERPRDWDKFINPLLFAYREVPQESLGFSPFELLFGRTIRGPMMILKELWTKDIPDTETKSTYQYVLDLKERLEETCKLAQTQLKSAKVKQAKFYNRHTKDRFMKVGDKVLVLLPVKNNKLLMQWKGPYVVEERKGPMDYKVNIDGKSKTLHINLLRLYVERKTEKDVACGVFSSVSVAVVEDDDEEGNSFDHPNSYQHFQTEGVDDVHVSESLDADQRGKVNRLLNEFIDLLTDLPGRTNMIEHDIRTITEEHVRVRGFQIPLGLKETIRKEIEKMLLIGVIEPSESPYAAPVVIVRKKDGSNRFCVDYRQLNKVTIFDAEPMPDADDIFSRLSGSKFFSKLDLSKGYWQVPMSEAAKQKTAFLTPLGLFHFIVMPFGLVNAPATFCRLMRKVLHGVKNVESFIDDILVFTDTFDEHIYILQELFSRLRSAGLTARPSKCFIAYGSIQCLGHRLEDQRLMPDNDKVKAILDAPRPKTKRQVRSFIGMSGFYRKFVPNFASVSAPLTDLTKKGQPNKIIWGEPQELAFQSLKKCLTEGPILKLPNLESEFTLQTDASDQGLGAVLLQCENEYLLPVAYVSRKLKDSEKSYSTIEKECLAVIWAIQRLQKYLYGRQFVLETDHQPLLYLQKAKVANSRLMRWALLLQPFRFRIQAIEGKKNVGADFLSRCFSEQSI